MRDRRHTAYYHSPGISSAIFRSCQQYITAHGRLAPPIIIRDARGDLSPVFRTTAFRTSIFPQVVIIRERKSGTLVAREAFKILRRLISDFKQRIPLSILDPPHAGSESPRRKNHELDYNFQVINVENQRMSFLTFFLNLILELFLNLSGLLLFFFLISCMR